MTDALNDKTPKCPVCGGYTPSHNDDMCVECHLYKADYEKNQRDIRRAKHFGKKRDLA